MWPGLSPFLPIVGVTTVFLLLLGAVWFIRIKILRPIALLTSSIWQRIRLRFRN